MTRFLPLLLLLACGGSAEGAEFEVGTGSWRFEAVEDGDPVDLIRGAQGGWHIWLAARTTDIREGDMLRLLTGPADGELAETLLRANFDPVQSDGFRSFVGWTAFVFDAECAVGNMFRLRAELLRDGEAILTSERDVLVRPGADPPGECQSTSQP